MKLHYSELENGVRLIKLVGKLDGYGMDDIEVEFIHLCTGDGLHIVADVSRVSYISSIAIPMLVNTARSVARRGGRMALLGPQRNVLDVLELVGVSQTIPICYDLKSATAAVIEA